MHILFVEDHPELHSALRDELEPLDISLDIASHAEDAIQKIDAGGFDLLLCDLKIPASKEAPEAHKEHGIRVFDHAQVAASGVPVLIFSAFGEMADLGDRLAVTPLHDLFGDGPKPMAMERKKSQLSDVIAIVREHRDALHGLTTDIEINGSEAQAAMSELDLRLVAIHARKHGGVMARVALLTQGQSGGLTLRVDAEKTNGTLASRVVAKLNTLDEIDDEQRRYAAYVSPLLDAGTYTDCLETLQAGARNRGGLFYSLAAGYNESLFEVLRRSSDDAATALKTVQTFLSPWHASAAAEQCKVAEVRAMFVRDERLSELLIADMIATEAESRSVQVRSAPCHGDLHGDNVLVNGTLQPMLIDFGRVRAGVNAIDPVTLELSAVLHPRAGIEFDGWPSTDQAANWNDLSTYTEGCPIASFVRACREWAQEISRGEREIDAVVYGFALRQLLFPEVNRDLAIAYSQGAAARIAPG
jgi:CheY-like chemotaxis protein